METDKEQVKAEKDFQKHVNQEKQTGSTASCEHGPEHYDYPNVIAVDKVCITCRKEKRKAEEKIKNIETALKLLSLPKRLDKCEFTNYKATGQALEAKNKCEDFANNPTDSGGIVMIGGVGTGKTHLAVAVCKVFCRRGDSAKIVTVPEIIREVRSTWKNPKRDECGDIRDEADVIKEYSRKWRLLVIDEVGSQYGTDGEKIIISEIINNRYNNMLPTIVVGNVTLPDVIGYLGNRAIDRIIDNGHVIVFDWGSHRKKATT